jgi:hypothetical protein
MSTVMKNNFYGSSQPARALSGQRLNVVVIFRPVWRSVCVCSSIGQTQAQSNQLAIEKSPRAQGL